MKSTILRISWNVEEDKQRMKTERDREGRAYGERS
jgi:hypothetical protein